MAADRRGADTPRNESTDHKAGQRSHSIAGARSNPLPATACRIAEVRVVDIA